MLSKRYHFKSEQMQIKNFILFSILSLSLVLQGCLDDSESDFDRQVREADELIEAYLSEHQREAERQSSGVYIEVVEENESGRQVLADHVVGIVYTMTHLEGEYEIESHSDTLNPVRFRNFYSHNFNAIYPPGLNYEIGNMKLGETFRFYIPSYRAYGNFGHDDLFESHSHFIIEVGVVDLMTEDQMYEMEVAEIEQYIEDNELDAEAYSNGLQYVTVEEGSGDRPVSHSLVEFHFTRKYLDGTVLRTTEDEEPILTYVNSGELVAGLENGLPLIREGGKGILIMPSRLAFGMSVQILPQQLRDELVETGEFEPSARPYSPLIYEVELLSVD